MTENHSPDQRPAKDVQLLYRKLRERNERRQHETARRLEQQQNQHGMHPANRDFRHPSR